MMIWYNQSIDYDVRQQEIGAAASGKIGEKIEGRATRACMDREGGRAQLPLLYLWAGWAV